MMEQKEINRMRLVHAGKILSSLCIVGAVYLLLVGAIPMLTFLWYIVAGILFVVLFFIKLITAWQAPFDLGAVSDMLFGGGDMVGQAFEVLSKGLPYVFVLTVLFAASAIVLYLMFDKYKRKGRVIVSSVAVVIGVIGMLLGYLVAPGIIASGVM